MRKLALFIVATILFLSSNGMPAHAQATRTWVSGVGDDANPCSRTAPCKTWAGAIAKTVAGGEIDALDPGGFGAVTITQAITLASDGNLASVLVSGTPGIVVAAGAHDVVTLRGLEVEGINGSGSGGTNGIVFSSGDALHVEKCAIRGFTTDGILFEPSGASALFVSDTDIGDNGGTGIEIEPSGSGVAAVHIDRAHVSNNKIGIEANGGGTFVDVSIRDSVVSGNSSGGVIASSSGSALRMMVSRVMSSFNSIGFEASGTAATIWIGDSAALANGTGLMFVDGGSLLSYGDNQINGNGTDGMPSGSATFK